MPRPLALLFPCAFFCVILSIACSVQAASLREQRADIRSANTAIRAAERLADSDRLNDAKAAYEDAEKLLTETAKELDPKAAAYHKRTTESLVALREKLNAKGAGLPEASEAEAAPADATTMDQAAPQGRFDNGQVSFVKQVAPVLVAKCGNCHVDRAAGRFSLASYNNLMAGSEDGGRVLVPGEGTGGVMMDLIESGDMPRGGLTMLPEETSLLSRWITQGAKFDGQDPNANLKQLQPSAAPRPQARPKPAELKRATGHETVSFALDVAPILVARCNNCHVLDNRGNLAFANFQQLLRSGIVTPGKPESSSLVRRIKGEETPRMPQNAPPLSDDQIAKIETWVREGATFDGDSPQEGLQRSTAIVRAARATPEELAAIREEQTSKEWRLALPDEPMNTAKSDHYLVAGSANEDQLQAVADDAEEAAAQASKLIGGAPDKAPVTIYAFRNRLDYGEFAQMVEKRQLPDGARGHYRHDPVSPYACLVLDSDQESEDDQPTVFQQVAALQLASYLKSRAPDWFVEGASRVAEAKAYPKAPEVQQWKNAFRSHLTGMNEPDDFMKPNAAPEPAGVVSMYFVEGMLRNRRNYTKLLQEVESGKSFDEAFKTQYRVAPAEMAKLWRASVMRGR